MLKYLFFWDSVLAVVLIYLCNLLKYFSFQDAFQFGLSFKPGILFVYLLEGIEFHHQMLSAGILYVSMAMSLISVKVQNRVCIPPKPH